jgi:hypothetical protein
MSVLAPERNPDLVVGDSPCCAGGRLRRSEVCRADYCDVCDTWHGQPEVEAVHLGPTWQRDPATGLYVAPEHSLGKGIAEWVHRYVASPDGEGPWVCTPEQLRLLYHVYALRRTSTRARTDWVYRELNVQRLKAWGKDPFAAMLALVEMVGPCRLDHWDEHGDPVGRAEPAAWVQVMAVAKAQTKNTMKMFATLVGPRMRTDYHVVVGKEQVVALGGERTIEAVTSAPATMEGNRPTFQIGGEPHWWRENNDGHAMREVMDRNNKRPGSRILWITNAYNPSEMSVGQANREGWELARSGEYADTGVMYDSLEAPESARMVPREIPVVLAAVRGDSHWVDIDAITKRILDPRNSVATSRRFYFNQIGADDEAWADPKDVDATIHPQVKTWRADPDIDVSDTGAAIRLGWAPVEPDEPVVLFFDGGKSDDHTAISGYRLADDYLFSVGYWGRPARLDSRERWFAPREDVDDRVTEAMDRFRVVALWADPSHAKDDEDDTPYWDGLLDVWHRRWKDQLGFWAVKTGEMQHAVKWDMTSPARQAVFVQGAEEFVRALEDHALSHDGHPMFVRYMKNAKALQTRYGTSLWKGARGSKRKIDGAVTHVGARMLGQLVLNRQTEEKTKGPKAGRVWGY